MAKNATLKRLGDAIRTARKVRGLTQATVAEKADLAVETISRIEAGDVNISLGALERVARDALGVPLSQLLEAAPKVKVPARRPALTRITALVGDLPDEDLGDLYIALRALLRVRRSRQQRRGG